MPRNDAVDASWHPLLDALNEHRIQERIQWKELSDALGYARQGVQSSFNGTCTPGLVKFERIAQALGFWVCLVPMTPNEIGRLGMELPVDRPIIVTRNEEGCDQSVD